MLTQLKKCSAIKQRIIVFSLRCKDADSVKIVDFQNDGSKLWGFIQASATLMAIFAACNAVDVITNETQWLYLDVALISDL